MPERLTIEVSDYALKRLEKLGVKREEHVGRVVTLSDSDGNAFDVVFVPKKAEKKEKVEKKKLWQKSSPSKKS